MSSVMEELYCGNIQADSRFYGKDSLFVETAKARNTTLEKLLALLNEEEKELFEEYRDAQSDIEGIARYDTFSYALKFGILLMAEVFIGRSEVTGCEEANDE